jgi:putative transposase
MAEVIARRDWKCHAYLLTNHFHLLVTTPSPDLCRGMQWLVSCHAQWFNRRYGSEGHVVERRYRDRVIDSDAYRLLVARYVFRNPVEAGIVEAPAEWPWSSYAATVGLAEPPEFLAPGWVLEQFGDDVSVAQRRLCDFVEAEPTGSDPAAIW